MSNSLEQWIDTANLKRLAESLLAPAVLDQGMLSDIPYGKGFVGFADAPDVETGKEHHIRAGAKNALREASALAEQAGILRNPASLDAMSMPRPNEKTRPVWRAQTAPLATREFDATARIPNASAGERAKSTHKGNNVDRQIHPEEVIMPTHLPKTPQLNLHGGARIESPFRIVSRGGGGRLLEPIAREPEARNASEPAPVNFSTPEVPLAKRLLGFGDWMRRSLGARAYFVCDRHGELLLDTVENEKLLQVARILAHASNRANRQTGGGQNPATMQVRIGPSALMEVLPVPSPHGLIVLAVILEKPLEPSGMAELNRALALVLGQGE